MSVASGGIYHAASRLGKYPIIASTAVNNCYILHQEGEQCLNYLMERGGDISFLTTIYRTCRFKYWKILIQAAKFLKL